MTRVCDGERLRVLHLDRAGALLGVTQSASIDAHLITLPVRRIVADALQLGSVELIVSHSHTTGDPRPSAIDIATTRRLATIMGALDIVIRDHVITAGAAMFSFRDAGLV